MTMMQVRSDTVRHRVETDGAVTAVSQAGSFEEEKSTEGRRLGEGFFLSSAPAAKTCHKSSSLTVKQNVEKGVVVDEAAGNICLNDMPSSLDKVAAPSSAPHARAAPHNVCMQSQWIKSSQDSQGLTTLKIHGNPYYKISVKDATAEGLKFSTRSEGTAAHLAGSNSGADQKFYATLQAQKVAVKMPKEGAFHLTDTVQPCVQFHFHGIVP